MYDLDCIEQERMCELCEQHIIECSSMSSTFMCEGRFCVDAYELFIDEVGETYFKRKILNKKLNKICLIK